MKQIPANEIRDFIFENYYKRIGFSTENSYYSLKHLKKKYLQFLENKSIKKVPNLNDAKEHFQSFIRNKNRKSVKE